MTYTSLIYLSPGSQSWKRFSLPEPQTGLTISIGRGVENTLILDDTGVSTKHAILLIDPQGIYILDQNSSNSTAVNGQWIAQNEWVNIPPGSSIVLGGTTFYLEFDQPPGFATAASQQFVTPLYNSTDQSQIYHLEGEIKKKSSVVPFIMGGVVLILGISAAVILLFGGNKLIKRLSNTENFTSDQNLTINADGYTITDKNGVSVTVPTNALNGTSAVLSSKDVPDELKQEMSKGYDLLSPAYSLTAAGVADGSDPGVLTFPAETEEFRLLALIDGLYVAELNFPPENGVISIDIDLHPSDLGDLAGTDSMWKSGSIQYVLVRPKNILEGYQSSTVKLAAPAIQEKPYSCVSFSYVKCWQNINASIQLMMDKTISLSPVDSNKVINYIQTTMDNYEKEGFNGAIYSARNPVQVVVFEDSGTPYYQVANGVIYLPNDVAKKLAAGESDDFLVHELAHWIQDKNYYMISAYFSKPDTWWIETSADNMAMLIDKEYIIRNLHTYGKLDVDDKMSVLQSSPYKWPIKEYYAQAQLVKVNMCESGCPISKNSFITAINNGTYPYADETAKSLLHNNLSDYARYLLGFAPEKANANISLAGVKTGNEYGDNIIVKQTHNSAFNLEQNTGIGRLSYKQGDVSGMLIETTLEKDGVYVLRVEVAPGNSAPQWPGVLTIEPGVEIYYRLNNGGLLFHDGKSKLVIQPLMQGSTGQEIAKIRLVALGQQGGELFKAYVGTADLSGMWIVNLPDESVWKNNIMCESDDDDKEFIAKMDVPMTSMQLMFGDFIEDISAHMLTWSPNLERANTMLSGLGEIRLMSDSSETFSAAATIDKTQIHFEATSFVPEDTTFEVRPEAYTTTFISCPGTFQIKADFDNLAFFGIEDLSITTGLPNIKVWKLSGDNINFIVDCEFLIQRVNSSAQIEEEEERNHCTGTVEVPADISIYQTKK